MVNRLALITGSDIPIPKLGLTFHVPTCKEIGFVCGEEALWSACGLLTFSKKILSEEDNSRLKDLNDFNVLMLIINSKSQDQETKQAIINLVLVLSLFFPNCSILLRKDCIVLKEYEGEQIEHIVDNDIFCEIRNIVRQAILGGQGENTSSSKPMSEMEKRIRAQIEEGHRKLAKLKGETNKELILDLYLSIVSIYLRVPLNELSNCTIYQLLDMFQRAQLKDQNDIIMQCRLAGAKDVHDAEDWMKDIHSKA